MAAGNPKDYVLFHPKKRRANKALALKLAAKEFDGEIVDDATIVTPEWGILHVSAYTDRDGAMVTTTEKGIGFGDAEWHSKERIVLVREQPGVQNTKARITFYICQIEDLFEHKTIGHAGVPWPDIGKIKLHSKIYYSRDLVEDDPPDA